MMDVKNEIDLSGKLIIKVQLGDDIRRIPIHNEAITYDELVLMMQRVFRGKLSANDDIVLKYRDEDGDLITIFDNSDLSFAIQCSRILKLQILFKTDLKRDSCKDGVAHREVNNIKLQLKIIRDQVNKLIDCLDTTIDNNVSVSSNAEHNSEGKATTNALNKVNSSEFDPLQDKSQKNGNEEPKDSIKTSSTPQATNEGQNSRPQSVSVASTQGGPTQSISTSVANQNSHNMSEYFNRTTSSNYPQVQYNAMQQYGHQYGYPPTSYAQQPMDNSQVPNSSSYATSQPGMLPYLQQQQFSNPSGVFPTGVQGNPYSAKGFTQPSPQHNYLPPRQ